MMHSEPGEFQLRKLVADAIRQMRREIKWKPGKGEQHLQTRIDYGHLSTTSTLADYEAIICDLLLDETAEVYVYVWQQDAYPTVVGYYGNRRWLVMFNLDGTMETAFPPTDPDTYLSDPRFHRLTFIRELLL